MAECGSGSDSGSGEEHPGGKVDLVQFAVLMEEVSHRLGRPLSCIPHRFCCIIQWG